MSLKLEEKPSVQESSNPIATACIISNQTERGHCFVFKDTRYLAQRGGGGGVTWGGVRQVFATTNPGQSAEDERELYSSVLWEVQKRFDRVYFKVALFSC